MRRHPARPDSTSSHGAAAPLTWAAVLGLLTACGAGCASTSTGSSCDTDQLPKTDPCYQKSCCDQVTVGPDGGVIADAGPDAGPGVTTRICGACNG